MNAVEPEPVVVEDTTASGQRRRIKWIPRYPQRGYVRVEEVKRGCQWREVGSESVTGVVVDAPDAMPVPID